MIYIIYKPGIIVFIYPGYKLHGTGNILMIKGILHTLRAEYSHYFYLCLGYSIVFCSLWFKASKCWNNGKENSIPTTEMVENWNTAYWYESIHIDGCSFQYAHIWSKYRFLKQFGYIGRAVKCIFFLKRPFLLNTSSTVLSYHLI